MKSDRVLIVEYTPYGYKSPDIKIYYDMSTQRFVLGDMPGSDYDSWKEYGSRCVNALNYKMKMDHVYWKDLVVQFYRKDGVTTYVIDVVTPKPSMLFDFMVDASGKLFVKNDKNGYNVIKIPTGELKDAIDKIATYINRPAAITKKAEQEKISEV